MSSEVEHSESVKEFLTTHPGAEDVRLAIACIARGMPPRDAVVALDPRHPSFAIIDGVDRCLWWHWEGSRLLIDEISEP